MAWVRFAFLASPLITNPIGGFVQQKLRYVGFPTANSGRLFPFQVDDFARQFRLEIVTFPCAKRSSDFPQQLKFPRLDVRPQKAFMHAHDARLRFEGTSRASEREDIGPAG